MSRRIAGAFVRGFLIGGAIGYFGAIIVWAVTTP